MFDTAESPDASNEVSERTRWRNVWHVPKSVTGWRSQLERLRGDEYYGTGCYDTQAEAEARGRSDQEGYEEMGFPVGVRFLRSVACHE